MKKIKDLREKTIDELLKLYDDTSNELMKWNAGKIYPTILPRGRKQGSVNWGLFKKLKKQKARILTILNQRGIKI